ncbi:MAG: DUF1707 domain-containing protein [Catenulispora sp.]|nr:DUF1707 domain-containing protein [Catenulispora sp.]
MPENPPKPPAVLASDADRDQVIDQLRGAVADGRLLPAEFDERVDAALAARTLDALAELTSDLGVARGAVGGEVARAPEAAVEKLTIKDRWGAVRREGRWTLPRRLVVRTRWSGVSLDLTQAVPTGPELIVDLRVRGGSVVLTLAPGMTLDANGLSARFSAVDINRENSEGAPEILIVRLMGQIKHGGVSVLWRAPR